MTRPVYMSERALFYKSDKHSTYYFIENRHWSNLYFHLDGEKQLCWSLLTPDFRFKHFVFILICKNIIS